MYFKEINEEESIDFTRDLLDYLSTQDDNVAKHILTSKDVESQRNNVGWYNYRDNSHHIQINIPNMLSAKRFVDSGAMNIDTYHAFVALCTSHEYRHYLQGRCIYDGIDTDGYNQSDVLNAELMLYIRYFFDAYYLLNKGNVKYELDAEKYAVANALRYLKEKYPAMDSEKALVNAVNFYAEIQSRGGVESTLPLGCRTTTEIIGKISDKLDKNYRIPELEETLFVYNPRFYFNHEEYGLDEDSVLDEELMKSYLVEQNGSKRDLMVVKKILSKLSHPEESLRDFPHVKEKYLRKTL